MSVAGSIEIHREGVPETPWFLRSRGRLLGTLCLTFALPLAGLVWFMREQVEQSLVQQAMVHHVNVTRLAAKLVEEHIKGLTVYVESYARRRRFHEAVVQRQVDRVQTILQEAVRYFPALDRVFVVDPKGTLWADFPPDPRTWHQSFAHRDWYQGVVERGATYVSEMYQRKAAPAVEVVAVAALLSGVRGEILGYLVGQHTIGDFSSWLQGMQMPSGGSLALMDHRGNVLMREDAGIRRGTFKDFPLAEMMAGTQNTVRRVVHPVSREEWVVSLQMVPGTGWAVYAGMPVNRILEPIRDLQRAFVGFALLCLGVMLGLGMMWLGAIRRSQASLTQMTERLQRANQGLEAANRELEAFSYSVSHDLRAPLRHIHSFADIMKHEYEEALAGEGRHYLAKIMKAAARMGALIEDLLKFSRMGRAKFIAGEVEMNGLIKEIQAEWAADLADGVVTWRVEALPVVHGDRSMLRVVWTNLLSNAVKYSRTRPEPRIEVGSRQDGGETVIHVKDNGVGFDGYYADKLFQVFQRLHSQEEFEGTGIGLAMVRRIMERHGGRVWAESTVGEGATFYVAFPNRPQ